ncbi:TPA: hydroxymethylbilane synthase, partial [Listeria monocytogenes]
MKRKIIVGSRRSKLALTQSNWVINKLKENYPEFDFEIKEIVTKGDRILDV